MMTFVMKAFVYLQIHLVFNHLNSLLILEHLELHNC